MEITGTIIAVPPIVSGTSSKGEWKKASIVVQYEKGQYPKSLVLTNMPKADAFSKLRVGQSGKFKFDGEVRQASNGNWYMDLRCWGWDIDAPASAPVDDDPF